MTELERLRGENVAMREALKTMLLVTDGIYIEFVNTENAVREACQSVRKALASSELSALYAAVVEKSLDLRENQIEVGKICNEPAEFARPSEWWEEKRRQELQGVIEWEWAVDALRVVRGGRER